MKYVDDNVVVVHERPPAPGRALNAEGTYALITHAVFYESGYGVYLPLGIRAADEQIIRQRGEFFKVDNNYVFGLPIVGQPGYLKRFFLG